MPQIALYLEDNKHKTTNLTLENNLVYNDDGCTVNGNHKTTIKFALLTLASPLNSIVRLIRSVAFACVDDFERAKREFIGGLAYPFISGYCFFSSLLSSIYNEISSTKINLYVQMRRTYAFFEAWVNKIDLLNPNLVTYSQRVSNPFDFSGEPKGIHKYVWTTAPCMQPVLEKAEDKKGGLLDIERMKKIFPFLKIRDIYKDNGRIVLKAQHSENYSTCHGTISHRREEDVCCCCYRINTIYDRICCCEVGQGTCSSISDENDSCGILLCNTCGIIHCCCCYVTNENEALVTGAVCC